MQLMSFCGEEEFYLAFLPMLFWTGHFDFGFHLTLCVTIGFLFGNILKDLFQLPRPTLGKIWRLSPTEEFGFPSTHAMNSLSNSLLVHQYLQWKVWWLPAMLGVWVVILCTSRMFLGMHTGTDIRGGLVLGALVYYLYVYIVFPMLTAFWHGTSLGGVFVSSFACAALVLLGCPQPTKQDTPSFGQNGLILGIMLGVIVGKRIVIEMSWDRFIIETQDYMLAKCLFGFVVLGLIRISAKRAATFVIQHFVPVKPCRKVLEQRKLARELDCELLLFSRDADILGSVAVKLITYFCCALWIGIGCALCWERVLLL